jgi:hypothetical protein
MNGDARIARCDRPSAAARRGHGRPARARDRRRPSRGGTPGVRRPRCRARHPGRNAGDGRRRSHLAARRARACAASRRRGAAARVLAGGPARSRGAHDRSTLPVAPRRPAGLGRHVDDVLRAGALRRPAAARPREPAARRNRRGGGVRRRDARGDAAGHLGDDGALRRDGGARLARHHVRLADDGRVDVRGHHPRKRRSPRGRRPAAAAGPDYQLKDEGKSIITVVAKTHHYWQAHVADTGQVARDGERG